MSVRVPAHAKVNLALSVGPPLPASAGAKAGFHPIASWFAALDLCDEVDVRALAGGPSRFEIVWASDAPRPSAVDWPLERDLAFRAHAALERQAGRALPVHAKVTKRVPVGGGLGGGSSDAAAMLVALDRAFDLRLGHAALGAIGQTLGSDVAFFLDEGAKGDSPRPALVTGLGERIERTPTIRPAHDEHAWIVLIVPPFGCPTGPVYRAFDALSPGPLRESEVRALAAGTWPPAQGAEGLFNDLTSAACAVEPRLAALIDAAQQCLQVSIHMTGSGSTLFALAQSEIEAANAARTVSSTLGAPAVPARLL